MDESVSSLLTKLSFLSYHDIFLSMFCHWQDPMYVLVVTRIGTLQLHVLQLIICKNMYCAILAGNQGIDCIIIKSIPCYIFRWLVSSLLVYPHHFSQASSLTYKVRTSCPLPLIVARPWLQLKAVSL